MMMFQTLHRVMAPADTLKIRCERCGHGADWPRATAIEHMGSGATPADVRRRLRCSRCDEGIHLKVWI